MAKTLSLEEIRDSIARIKQDISRKEGEKQAELKNLQKEYGLNSIDDAYKMLGKIEKEIQDKRAEKQKLMTGIVKKLEEYGYA